MQKKNGLYILAGSVTLLALSAYLFKDKASAYLSNKNNAQHLDSLNPKYKQTFINFVKHLERLGYKVQINSSYRSFSKQAELKRADRRNASPGFSPHNYGLAIDLQVSKNGKAWNKNTSPQAWINTGIPNLAKFYGLAWGGTFKGYKDTVHFYKDLNTSRLYSMALEQFKTNNPSFIQGNKLKLV